VQVDAELEADFQATDRKVADASGRAANLERIVGLMRAMGGDIAATDGALMATYATLGLLTRRRQSLMTMLEACRPAPDPPLG